MNSFEVNLIINNSEYKATVQIINNKMNLTYNGSTEVYSLEDISALRFDNETYIHIVSNKKVMTFKGDNVKNILEFLSGFKTYNNSNIKINPKTIKIKLKSPLGICMLHTILYFIIYRAIIGLFLYEKWNTNVISAIISCILTGGGSDYPTDTLEVMTYILLAIEIIIAIIFINVTKNRSINLLQNINKNNFQQQSISNLETLKQMLDKNIITQEDYDKKKQEILNKM